MGDFTVFIADQTISAPGDQFEAVISQLVEIDTSGHGFLKITDVYGAECVAQVTRGVPVLVRRR